MGNIEDELATYVKVTGNPLNNFVGANIYCLEKQPYRVLHQMASLPHSNYRTHQSKVTTTNGFSIHTHKRAAYLGRYGYFCQRIFRKRSHWLSSLRFDGGLINGLSTAFVDSLHGNLKVARRLLKHFLNA